MNETLEHHGILGMKWGVRRYQNKDGTWTKEGKKHRAEEETQKHGTSDTIEVKANSVFTKNELDAVKNNEVDDPELLELMLMEVIDATGYSDGEFEFDTSWEDEMEKFKKDPHNYTFRFKGYTDETIHSDDSSEDILEHHGILGMKWGIRRFQNKDGSLTPAGRKRYGDDIPDGNASSNSSDATPRTAAKSASEMTDQELNQALNRLRMEQQYNELTGAKSSNQYQNQQNFQNPPSNTGALSNAELQAYITRLDMEKRYAQLTAPPPKELNWGQKFIKEALPAVAMEVAKEWTKKSLKKLVGIDGDKNNDKDDNNDNGGNKKNKQSKDYDSKFNETNSRIDKLANAVNNLANKQGKQNKQQMSIVPANGDEQKETSTSLLPSGPSSSSRNSHRDSIFAAARDAASTARKNKRERDELQRRLSGYREARERSRDRDNDSRARAGMNFSDYYRDMWTYGM